MFLNEALLAISGRPDLFAWRPSGELVRMTNMMSIRDVRSGKPRAFQVKFSDILTNDWLSGDLAALQKYSAAHWTSGPADQPGE
jgi:hypothetical protein